MSDKGNGWIWDCFVDRRKMKQIKIEAGSTFILECEVDDVKKIKSKDVEYTIYSTGIKKNDILYRYLGIPTLRVPFRKGSVRCTKKELYIGDTHWGDLTYYNDIQLKRKECDEIYYMLFMLYALRPFMPHENSNDRNYFSKEYLPFDIFNIIIGIVKKYLFDIYDKLLTLGTHRFFLPEEDNQTKITDYFWEKKDVREKRLKENRDEMVSLLESRQTQPQTQPKITDFFEKKEDKK